MMRYSDHLISYLIRIGKSCTSETIRRLTIAIGYLEIGRYLAQNGYEVKEYVKSRYEIFDKAADSVGEQSVLYIEFGVAEGQSISYWSDLLKNKRAVLHGFDSFEGLPEDWAGAHPKGMFSTAGNPPAIDDERVSFHIGWFSETLERYVVPVHDLLIINCDADLYSSTRSVLTTMGPYIRKGTLLYLDEFSDVRHEFRAFSEFMQENQRTFEVLWATKSLRNIMFQCTG